MKKQTVSSQKLNEKPPHCEIKGAGMVKASDYLFFFGGRSDDEFTKMYVGNVRNSSWFVYYMLPDGESTSFVDGKISKEGLFLMPDTCDFSCSYVPERRQIFAFFGHPHKSPVPIFIVSIGDALAILNDMEDIRSMLIF